MNFSALSYLLFAQVKNWQRLGDGLHRGRGRMDIAELWPLAVLLVVVAVVVFVVVKVRQRNDMTEHCDDPEKLFRELSQAHQLDRGSKKLLWQLASSSNLAQPAEVFLKPGIFQAELPVDLREQEAVFATLQDRLFR